MDIAKMLGDFVFNLDYDSLPEDVKEKVKTCFLNTLGVGVSGWELGPAGHARTISKELDAKREGLGATLLMDGARLSMPGAVFANTVLFHSRAQEDTLGGVHNGTMIIPAVLAVAENYPCTGKEIMEAVLGGYEVTGALEHRLSKLSSPRGFRPSAIFVIFGVAAAAARLLRLPAEGIADAIRIAASLCGGIQESFAAGTTEWFYQNGCAARNGLLAAFLARDGVPGAVSAFDGVKGFMHVMTGSRDTELVRRELETLGQEWNIRRVTFKFNPCCAIAQTPFIAARDLALEKSLRPEDIAAIEYHMNPFESNYPGTKGKGPFTSDTQTTMSCAFNMANAIVNHICTKKGQQVFDNPAILDLVARTTVVDDESYAVLSGKVVVTMNDGAVYENEMLIDESYYQLSWEQNEKLMYDIHREVGIPEAKTRALVNAVKNLENTDGVAAIIEAVGRA